VNSIQYYIAKAMKILLHPPALNNCIMDKKAKVCAKSELNGCKIGRYSYVGYQNFMVNVVIGNYCSIADKCSIGGAMHPINFVSSSPVFHEGNNIFGKNFSTHTISHTPVTIIEHDVWIGQGAFIKAGVKISTGAVIGMGAVVTHNVGPYEIWAGNPAKCIRKRFDKDIIDRLLASKWWEWDEEKIKNYSCFMNNPSTFLEKV